MHFDANDATPLEAAAMRRETFVLDTCHPRDSLLRFRKRIRIRKDAQAGS
jgi:hypothetical protein